MWRSVFVLNARSFLGSRRSPLQVVDFTLTAGVSLPTFTESCDARQTMLPSLLIGIRSIPRPTRVLHP